MKNNKISQDNAEKIFLEMKKAFGFNVTESKAREVSLIVRGQEIRTTQEIDPLEDIMRLIQEGRIEFDSEKTVIRFNLIKPLTNSQGNKFSFFEIGVFTRAMQKRLKIPLSELDPVRLDDEKLDSLMGIMTGVDDTDIFGNMPLPEFNCLRSVAQVFFG